MTQDFIGWRCMLNKSYNSIFDFINDKVKITYDGKIKVVEKGSDKFLNRQELKSLCFKLKEQIEKKQIRLLVKKDGLFIAVR